MLDFLLPLSQSHKLAELTRNCTFKDDDCQYVMTCLQKIQDFVLEIIIIVLNPVFLSLGPWVILSCILKNKTVPHPNGLSSGLMKRGSFESNVLDLKHAAQGV